MRGQSPDCLGVKGRASPALLSVAAGRARREKSCRMSRHSIQWPLGHHDRYCLVVCHVRTEESDRSESLLPPVQYVATSWSTLKMASSVARCALLRLDYTATSGIEDCEQSLAWQRPARRECPLVRLRYRASLKGQTADRWVLSSNESNTPS